MPSKKYQKFLPMNEYESQLGVFAPDGRLIQVEYAQNASNQGGTIVLQTFENKIVVCYEIKNTNPLIIPTSKIHTIDQERNIYMIFSGFKADSLIVANEAVNIVCNYKYSTSEDISLSKLARKIAEYKQTFTVNQRLRPFGLRSVLFGFEETPKVFVIETDGNFAEYSRYALGFKNEVCNEFFVTSNNENSAFKALSEVIQMDYNKVEGYVLDQNGLIKLSKQEIKESME